MSSESGTYYGGHDDEATMSYTDHDDASIEDMGYNHYTDDESEEEVLPSPELCAITHDVIDFSTRKEMCGIAEEIYPDCSNIELASFPQFWTFHYGCFLR